MPKYIVKSYLGCKRCGLCNTRREIVFGRGSLPATILFIGEAPSVTDDLLGIPFVGPAGKLLDAAIKRGCEMMAYEGIHNCKYCKDGTEPEFGIADCPKCFGGVTPPPYFITNSVACRPTDVAGGENREPNADEIWACYERLQHTYNQVQPKVVVFLGEVARKHLTKAFPQAYNLRHPSYLIRRGGVESPEFRAMARDLSAIFRGAEVLTTKLRK